MPNPLADIAWEECLLEPVRDREGLARLRRETGQAPGWSHYFLATPWVAKAGVRLSADQDVLADLDFAEAHLVALVVSQESSCRYCYAALRAMLRVLGFDEARVQEMEQRVRDCDFEPRRAALVSYARRFARANPLATPGDQAALREAGFSAGEIREVAFVAAATVFSNRLSTIAALSPQGWERLPDRWWMRALRPVVALLVQAGMRGGRRAGDASARRSGIYAPVLRVFDGSPIAPLLAETLDDMAASPALPSRSKALMLAVIARGLECRAAQREARALLQREGFDDAAIDDVLSHLSGGGLDARERALLRFARETIWYEPVQIQRRARDLREYLDQAALVEAVGVVSLANAMCRLGAALVATE